MASDPEVGLMFARKTAEAVCKIIYFDKVSEHVPPPTALEDLLVKLKHGKHLSKHLELQLRTIQTHGNFGSHDQGDDSDEIGMDYVEPCIKSLDYLCKWLLKDYLRDEYKIKPLDKEVVREPTKESKKDSQEKHCYLMPPITIKALSKAIEVAPFMLVAMLKHMEIFTSEDGEISPEIAERVCKQHKWKFKLGPTSLRDLGV